MPTEKELERQLEHLIATKTDTVAWRYKLGCCLRDLKKFQTSYGGHFVDSIAEKLRQNDTHFHKAIQFANSFQPEEVPGLEALGWTNIINVCKVKDKQVRGELVVLARDGRWSTRQLEDEIKKRKKPQVRGRGLLATLTNEAQKLSQYIDDVWPTDRQDKVGETEGQLELVECVKMLKLLSEQIGELIAKLKRRRPTKSNG